MATCKANAGHERRQAQLVHLTRYNLLPAAVRGAMTGTDHVVAGTHQVHGAAVRVDIVQPDPKIEIPAVTGCLNDGGHGAGDLQIVRQRLGVEGKHILARLELPVIVRAEVLVRVNDGIARVRNEGALRD